MYVEAAHAAILAGRAVLVDVRGIDSYRAAHAQDALLIPVDEIERAPDAALRQLPAGKQPIFYCT